MKAYDYIILYIIITYIFIKNKHLKSRRRKIGTMHNLRCGFLVISQGQNLLFLSFRREFFGGLPHLGSKTPRQMKNLSKKLISWTLQVFLLSCGVKATPHNSLYDYTLIIPQDRSVFNMKYRSKIWLFVIQTQKSGRSKPLGKKQPLCFTAVGYSDHTRFCTAFKAYTGTTPLQYRKSRK